MIKCSCRDKISDGEGSMIVDLNRCETLQHSKFIFYPIKMSLMVLCNALEKMTVTGKLMVELMVLATVSASTTVSLNGSPKAKEKVR